MSVRMNVVTGATGLLGSHIAEQLASRGEVVRAIVRPGSGTAFLDSLGVESVDASLQDLASLEQAVAGAEVVYHCAAHVSDWGPWRRFRQGTVDSMTAVLEACRAGGVGRVLHVSSSQVYGHPHTANPVTESAPLGRNLRMWDHYPRAKIIAEEMCRAYCGAWTMIRPTWLYGPRDRHTLPSLIRALRAGRVRILGEGHNAINLIYAGDVADAAIRAATSPQAVGEIYNVAPQGELTQKQLLDLVSDMIGLPRVTRHISLRLATFAGLVSEVVGKLIRLNRRPHITRYAVGILGSPTLLNSAKAQSHLGWRPVVSAADGLRLSLDWLRAQPGSPLAQVLADAAV